MDENNNSDSIEKMCFYCNEKSKFKLCEDIEKELIKNFKLQDKQTLLSARNTSENEPCVFSEFKIDVDEKSRKITKTKIAEIKEFVLKLLQNVKKVMSDYEKALSECNKKNLEMINTLKEKDEYIKELEKQNYYLQCEFNEISQRLDLLEMSLERANAELNYLYLGKG